MPLDVCMYDQLLHQVPLDEPYCMMRRYLWNYDLLAALDEHARLLDRRHYNMHVCHLILDLLRVNEIRPGMVRRIEAEFFAFQQWALDRYAYDYASAYDYTYAYAYA